jgi:hypothetical protein
MGGRVTLRERFFPLHQPADVDQFLARFPWCVVFKAGTSEKTFDAWLLAQRVLEPRVDVPVGFVRLPEDRAASDRVTAISDVAHRSPQLILFHDGRVRDALPDEIGAPVRNEAIVSLAPYRALLADYLSGSLPEERFQWAYLERLEKDALWRDDETFALLNGLFENPSGQLRLEHR